MPHKHLWLRPCASYLLLFCFINSGIAADPIKINGPLVSGGGVTNYSLQFSPDSSRVLYLADQDTDQVFELYSVPSGGGTPTKLNGTLVGGGGVDVFNVDFSPDSSRVLYNADQDSDEVFEVYSVLSGGGTPVKLNGPLISGGDVSPYSQEFSPDSSFVLYNADQDTDGVNEIYSVPSGGGTPVKLNDTLVAGGNVFSIGSGLQFSPDSSRVLYTADQDTDEIFEIYSVPSGGGTPVKLNGPLVAGGIAYSSSLHFSPDSSRVLYVAEQDTLFVKELYSVPSSGGTPVKLNDTLVTNGDVSSDGLQFSPNGSRVLYLADQDTDQVNEIYSVPSGGGSPVKLNDTLVAGGDVFSSGLQFSPDSSRVLYNADQDTDGVTEIYSVPSSGGTPVKLNDTLVAGGDVSSGGLQFSPDSSRVLYLADQDTDEVFEIYSVSSSGGTPVKLNDTLVAGGDVSYNDLQFSPDSSRVLYRADQDTDGVIEAYLVPSEGGTPVKINGPLVAGGSLSPAFSGAVQFSPDGSKVLYLAAQDTAGVAEAYIRIIRDRSLGGGGDWDTPGTWDQNVLPDEVMQVFIESPVVANAGTPRTVNELIVADGSASLALKTNADINATNGLFLKTGILSIEDDGSVLNLGTDPLPAGSGLLNIGSDGRFSMDDGSVTAANFTRAVGGTFDFTGGTFEIDGGDGVFNSSYVVEGPQATAPDFRATDGADVAVDFSWQIGTTAGQFGSTFISGVNGARRSTIRGIGGGGGADLVVGLDGTGTLTVLDGGLADLRDDFILGFNSTGNGTAVISGVNGAFRSTVEANNSGGNSAVQIGASGFGDLTIASGGLVTTSGDAWVGQSGGALGLVTLSASSGGFDATLEVADDMGIGGTTTSAGGTAIVSVFTGGLLEVGGTTQVWDGGTLTLDGGSVITTDFQKTSGATFTFNGGTFEVRSGDSVFNTSMIYGGPQAISTPTFKATQGADVAVDFAWQIGASGGEFGATLITGVNGARRSTIRGTGGGGGADLVVGVNGTGTLTVLDGGLADLRDDFILGNGSTGDGTAVVSGVNGAFRSTVEANNSGGNSAVQVGVSGIGDLAISSGGLVMTSGDAFVGQSSGSNGTLTIGGSSGGFDATLDVADDMGIGGTTGSAGGTANVTVNTGGLLQVDDTLKLWGAGTLNLLGGTLDAATIDHTEGGTFNFTGGRLQVDTFTGSLTNQGGTLAPGSSPGTTAITGNYDQPFGSLEIEISGLTAGTNFDLVSVTGTATLGGDLTIDLLSGFIPDTSDSFTVLSAGDLSGSFNNVADGARLATVAGTADFLVNYDGTTDTVVLSDFAPILDGDLNIDGFVDASDAGVMFANWGPTTLGYFDGNLNGDAFVDAADAGIMFANWTGDTGPLSATIPEPTTLLLASLAGCMLLQRKQRI